MASSATNRVHSFRIDNIRAITILLVVFGHSIIIYSHSWNLYSSANSVPILDYIKSFIDLVQMPLFFAVAGYLFVSTLSRKSKQVIVVDKIKRLLVPYACFSFCWLVPIRMLVGYPGFDRPLSGIIWNCILLGEDNGHLWFLISLFECFIIRIIVDAASDKFASQFKRNSNGVALAFSFLIAASIVVGRAFDIAMFEIMPVHYIWFALGEDIRTVDSYYKQKDCLFLFVIAAAVSILFVIASFITDGTINSMLTMIASACLVIFTFEYMPEKSVRPLEKLAGLSFGIYLIHSPLVYITYTLIPNANPLVLVFINFVLFGLFSGIATHLLRKSKLKFAIGETG